MSTYDKLWKAILEDLFEDFLVFFYANAAELFDFNRGFEFLDKELEQLFPESEGQKNRYVDKLVKVWLKDGTSRWILIHCEVQGYFDGTFEERMFIYYYRIFDKYQVEISSIAILSDNNSSFLPQKYEKEFLGTRLTFEFQTYKILKQNAEELELSNNPFAVIILTSLKALQANPKNDENLLNIKLQLMRQLKKQQFSNEKIRSIFSFIKMYIRFENIENNRIFEEQLENIYPPKNNNMGVIEMLIQDAKEEAFEKGTEKGIEKGIEKKEFEVIRNAREEGMSIEIIARIVKLPIEQVREILNKMNIA